MDILKTIEDFYNNYKGEKLIYGFSEAGFPLYAFFIGKKEKPTILCQYSIHAREYINSYLALEHTKFGLEYGGAWILPLTNPDGVRLCLDGVNFLDKDKANSLIKINNSKDFSLWKSNINGVDLNVNFEADWGNGEKNVTFLNSENYIGKYPFSESESAFLRDFTLKVMPDLTLSYHSKGEIIYYGFKNQAKEDEIRDLKIADFLSKLTSYAVSESKNSCGGYKDWCVDKLKIPSFTIETGSDNLTHPIKADKLPQILLKNKTTLNEITKYLYFEER